MILKKTVACLKKHKNFILTTHTNPEGDAIGSELALGRLLRSMGKRVTVVNPGPIPEEYLFLPGTRSVKVMGAFNASKVPCDCFVTVDCSDLFRCGSVAPLHSKAQTVLNIDHHVSNGYFGSVNWVEPRASSTAEMIYRLYKTVRKPFDRQCALLLYTGIMTDTGSFRYSNTTSVTHAAACEFLRYGIRPHIIYGHAYENIPSTHLGTLQKIIATMRQDSTGRLIWLKIKRSFFKPAVPFFDFSEYVLTLARAVKGVEVALLFKEQAHAKEGIRISFRSQGQVDVNAIARSFGGGGHPSASGCVMPGTINEVSRVVIAKVLKEIK